MRCFINSVLNLFQYARQVISCFMTDLRLNSTFRFPSRKHTCIILTPFYIVKLGLTGVYIIFLISAQKQKMLVLIRTASASGSNEYPQSMFRAEKRKISEFLSENFQFLVVKFPIYLKRRFFIIEAHLQIWWRPSPFTRGLMLEVVSLFGPSLIQIGDSSWLPESDRCGKDPNHCFITVIKLISFDFCDVFTCWFVPRVKIWY